MKPSLNFSTRSLHVLAIAREVTSALSVLAGERAMAPTQHSSNCWAANRGSTRSARNGQKSGRNELRKRVRLWKTPSRKADHLQSRVRGVARVLTFEAKTLA